MSTEAGPARVTVCTWEMYLVGQMAGVAVQRRPQGVRKLLRILFDLGRPGPLARADGEVLAVRLDRALRCRVFTGPEVADFGQRPAVPRRAALSYQGTDLKLQRPVHLQGVDGLARLAAAGAIGRIGKVRLCGGGGGGICSIINARHPSRPIRARFIPSRHLQVR